MSHYGSGWMQGEDSTASELESVSDEDDYFPARRFAEEFGVPEHDATPRVRPEAALVQRSIPGELQQST